MIKMLATGKCDITKSNSGFTLIELMVVLVIMVLLVASMPMALNRMLPGYRFRAAGEQLVTELRRAQSYAQAHGQIVVVACTEAAYSIQPADAKNQKTFSVPAKATLSCTALPGGRVVEQLILYPDGSAMGGVIAMTDGVRKAAVQLSALTGRARVIG